MSDLISKALAQPPYSPLSHEALKAKQAQAAGNVAVAEMPEADLLQLRTLLGTQDIGRTSSVSVTTLLTKAAETIASSAAQLSTFVGNVDRGQFEKSELYKLQAKMKATADTVELTRKYAGYAESNPDHGSFAQAVDALSRAHAQLTQRVLSDRVWEKIVGTGSNDRLGMLELAFTDLWGSTNDAWSNATDIQTGANLFPWWGGLGGVWNEPSGGVTREEMYPRALEPFFGQDQLEALLKLDRRLAESASAIRAGDPAGITSVKELWEERREIVGGARTKIFGQAKENGEDQTIVLHAALQLANTKTRSLIEHLAGRTIPLGNDRDAATASELLAQNGYPFPRREVMVGVKRYSKDEIAAALADSIAQPRAWGFEFTGARDEPMPHTLVLKDGTQLEGEILSPPLDWSRASLGALLDQKITDVDQPVRIRLRSGEERTVEAKQVRSIARDFEDAEKTPVSAVSFHESILRPSPFEWWNMPRYEISQAKTNKDAIAAHPGAQGAPGNGELFMVTVKADEWSWLKGQDGPVRYWVERRDGEIINGGWIDAPKMEYPDFVWKPAPNPPWFGGTINHDDPAAMRLYVKSLLDDR